jgi:hypothetical protein
MQRAETSKVIKPRNTNIDEKQENGKPQGVISSLCFILQEFIRNFF